MVAGEHASFLEPTHIIIDVLFLISVEAQIRALQRNELLGLPYLVVLFKLTVERLPGLRKLPLLHVSIDLFVD